MAPERAFDLFNYFFIPLCDFLTGELKIVFPVLIGLVATLPLRPELLRCAIT